MNILALFSLIPAISALDNGLGITPAMGWSTWNHFEHDINDPLIREVADALVENGFVKAGYEYLNVDAGWGGGRVNGIITPGSNFPNMTDLGVYVHNKGMKFGLYTARGWNQCGPGAGSLGFEYMDAMTFASWGVDYLKEDSCGAYSTLLSSWQTFALMAEAINATGRPMYFSICPSFFLPTTNESCYPFFHGKVAMTFSVMPWVNQGKPVQDTFNAWLVEYCNSYDSFGTPGGIFGLLNNLDAMTQLGLLNMSGPGHWNDMDMLEVCNDGGMTMDEYQSEFSLKAVLASPLIMSMDPRTVPQECIELLTNKEAIAINQDKLGASPFLAWMNTPYPMNNTLQIFARRLYNGDVAAVMFNRTPNETSITLTWNMIGFSSFEPMHIRDVLSKTTLGRFKGSFTSFVPSHAVTFIRLTPVGGGDEAQPASSRLLDQSFSQLKEREYFHEQPEFNPPNNYKPVHRGGYRSNPQ